MKMKTKIILSVSVLGILASAAIFAVSCRIPLDEKNMPKKTFAGKNWTVSFENPSAYTISNSEFKILSVPTGWGSCMSNSIYKKIEGTQWTVTVKVAVNFTTNNQNAGIVLGAPDGSPRGTAFHYTSEFTGRVGAWQARMAETTLTPANGVLINSNTSLVIPATPLPGSYHFPYVWLKITRNDDQIRLSYSTTTNEPSSYTEVIKDATGADYRTLKNEYKDGDFRLYLYSSCANDNTFTPVIFSNYTEVHE